MENARLVQTIPVVTKTPIAAEYASIVQVGLTQTGKAIIASINADQRVWYMVIVAVGAEEGGAEEAARGGDERVAAAKSAQATLGRAQEDD